MDVSELRGLTPQAAIEKAAAFANVAPGVLDGMWAAESARGQHPTMIGPDTKYGNAVGHFQSLSGTWATWEQRLKAKLDPFKFEDALYVAANQMKENKLRYGSDDLAVLAYHGGTDQKNWGAKTKAYLRKVLGAAKEERAAGLEIDPLRTTAEQVHAAYRVELPTVAPVAAPAVGLPLPAASSFAFDSVAQDAEAARQEAAARPKDVAFGTRVFEQLGMDVAPLYGAIEHVVTGAERPQADPGWAADYSANWQKYEAGFTEEELEKVRDSGSREDYEHRAGEILESRRVTQQTGQGGFWSAMGVSLAAGSLDPATWATGLAATKVMGLAGLSAARAVQAGQAGRAAALTTLEAGLGNVAYTGLQDVMGEYKGLSDYALDFATGIVPAPLFSMPAYRAASRVALQDAQLRLANQALAREAKLYDQAVANLGPEAPVAGLKAEVARLDAEGAKDRVRTALAQAPEADRIPAAEPLIEEVPPAADLEAAPGRSVDEVEAKSRELPPARLSRFDPALSVDSVKAAGAGVHLAEAVKEDAVFKHLADSARSLISEFLPGHGVTLTETVAMPLPDGRTGKPNGVRLPVTETASVIALSRGSNAPRTLTHEVGHIVEKTQLASATPEVRAGVMALFDEWVTAYNTPGRARTALAMRGPISRFEEGGLAGAGSLRDITALSSGNKFADAYYGQFSEFMAEQFNKYIEAGALGHGPAATVPLSRQIVQAALDVMRRIMELFARAEKQGLLRADPRAEAFFEGVRAAAKQSRQAAVGEDFALPVGGFRGSQMTQPPTPRVFAADWAMAQKYRLDLMPQSTPQEKAEFKQAIAIYRKAEAWAAANPRDDARTKTLLNSSLFQQAGTTGSLLALSDNPVARMVAGTLLENTTGALGRRATAAISKDMLGRTFLGNSILEYDGQFRLWAVAQGQGALKAQTDSLLGGTLRPRFDRMVAQEVEGRLRGATGGHPAVVAAADALERAHERMRLSQTDTKTVGWARLPETSRGYMPHRLNKERVMTLTPGEERAFLDVLTEQFQDLEDFDPAFSQELARKYLDRARVNANGGHEIPANVHDPAAADMVRGALEAMGMARDEVAAAMGRYAAGGPSHTKRRLHLDLNRPYPDGSGGELRLLDLFETDHLQLLRGASERISGEVALANFGVMGSQGLRLLRRSLEFGDHGLSIDRARVLEAFDQVSAEFLGRPFGEATGKWMGRAMTANAVARLGGMVFNQIGETINMFTHLGAGHALSAVASFPRLRAELSAMVRGEKVDGILSSLEVGGGAGEFGADSYKLVMAFDEPNTAYRTYGADTVTGLDRMLRGAGHAQSVLSGWRMVHAVQHRAAAEQIVLKSMRFIRDGLESAALKDMGLTDDIVARIRKELPAIATFGPNGQVRTLDVTKAVDQQAVAAYTQAVMRGSRQIIQGTYIGETGKWAHSGWLKLLSQFRTFGLVSMEKQWARQKANQGIAGVVGLTLGAMSAAAPLYMARVAITSLGRPDRDEYLEQQLQPLAVARATLNYIPMAGLAGDVLDLVSTVGGAAYTGITDEKVPEWAATQGGRSGANQSFVGQVVAPAASYADDVYKALQNLDDPHKIAQALPGSRLWWLMPAVNAMRPD